MKVISHNESFIELHYNNKNPVELLDLAISFRCFAENYTQHVVARGLDHPENAKLCIESIREGSIVTRLFASLTQPSLLPEMQKDVSMSWLDRFKLVANNLSGKEEWPEKEPPLKASEVKNISKSLSLLAKDNHSHLKICLFDRSKVINNFNVTTTDARAIQEGARAELTKNPEMENTLFSEELMVLHQVRNEENGEKGDFGIIEKFNKSAIHLYFSPPSLKAKILQAETPFKSEFIVSGETLCREGKIKTYKITQIHDAFLT